MNVFRHDRGAAGRDEATVAATLSGPPAEGVRQPHDSGTTPVSTTDLVVIGLGYVGLPLAREAAFSGLSVVGYDLNTTVVAALNEGRSHVGDVPASDVAEMLAKGFRATSEEAEAGHPDTVVICVPTPLSADSAPDLSAVRGAVEVTGRMLRPGMLVVLESTTYPGTTDEVVRPLLEKATGLTAGVNFSLAFSPERIDPGNPHYSVRNTPKVVGGQTPSCTDAAEQFYSRICDQVVRARSAREAEMTKLLENTYRHINIALVNEMAIFSRELGVDLRDAIRCAATKPFGFQAFYPGPVSEATAYQSTLTTSPTKSGRLATRSGLSSSPRRSTAGCRCTSSTGRPRCSIAMPSR